MNSGNGESSMNSGNSGNSSNGMPKMEGGRRMANKTCKVCHGTGKVPRSMSGGQKMYGGMNNTRKMSGGKRKASPWNNLVKKVFQEMKKKDKKASFGDALKEASRRKADM